ncbi:hypothetical protein [Trichocoleus sp. FACHB-46]|uniref:Uncharacterized protein n=1 Tax=Trichocoleus desertorum GB2-A4 TaxID=2933944 RepID=A0ABV0JGH3_9CYAN|nr:hypothetical protein [Trichocoleus sp. FACHB-46]MBD1865294.1 hypothetical protein [Trichocoleus sp. FACHB-46]
MYRLLSGNLLGNCRFLSGVVFVVLGVVSLVGYDPTALFSLSCRAVGLCRVPDRARLF